MKYVMGFFAFWYDFIVGDAWEVAAGVLVSLVLLFAVTHSVGLGFSMSTLGAVLLPLAIVGLLAFSLWRVRNSA